MSKAKKTSKPRRRQNRRRFTKPSRSLPNSSKIVETLSSVPINLNTPYIFSKAGITGVRAPIEAQLYGLYRIAHIKYTIKPLFDTYSSSLPGTGNSPNSIPTLYWKINRYGDAPNVFDGNFMRAQGAKPNRFDDRQVVIKYKPNMLMVAEDNAGNNASQVKITPWLSTDERPGDAVFNISTAEHFGHLMFIEGGGAGNAQGPCAVMDVEVVYEFKQTRVPIPVGQTLADKEAEMLTRVAPTVRTSL